MRLKFTKQFPGHTGDFKKSRPGKGTPKLVVPLGDVFDVEDELGEQILADFPEHFEPSKAKKTSLEERQEAFEKAQKEAVKEPEAGEYEDRQVKPGGAK